MNNLPTNPEPPDELDRLLSEFFKAQLKHPWPNAPALPAAAATPASEPATLVKARASEPRAARRDGTARARFTLAASVVLALGACWVLSNGFEPTAAPGNTPIIPAGPAMLPGSGADGNDHLPLKKMEENNAKPQKIDLGNDE
jgi:hypothetical protein